MTDILRQDQRAAMNRIDDLQATVTRLTAERDEQVEQLARKRGLIADLTTACEVHVDGARRWRKKLEHANYMLKANSEESSLALQIRKQMQQKAEADLATVRAELADEKSTFEAFAEHHRATEAENASLRQKIVRLEQQGLDLTRAVQGNALTAMNIVASVVEEWVNLRKG